MKKQFIVLLSILLMSILSFASSNDDILRFECSDSHGIYKWDLIEVYEKNDLDGGYYIKYSDYSETDYEPLNVYVLEGLPEISGILMEGGKGDKFFKLVINRVDNNCSFQKEVDGDAQEGMFLTEY